MRDIIIKRSIIYNIIMLINVYYYYYSTLVETDASTTSKI